MLKCKRVFTCKDRRRYSRERARSTTSMKYQCYLYFLCSARYYNPNHSWNPNKVFRWTTWRYPEIIRGHAACCLNISLQLVVVQSWLIPVEDNHAELHRHDRKHTPSQRALKKREAVQAFRPHLDAKNKSERFFRGPSVDNSLLYGTCIQKNTQAHLAGKNRTRR